MANFDNHLKDTPIFRPGLELDGAEIAKSGDFTRANVVEYWQTRPLAKFGDRDHTVFHLKCRQKVTAYAPPQKNELMPDASIRNSPFSNAEAFFVEDTTPKPLPNGRCEFTRKFATIPGDRNNVFSGLDATPLPAFFEAIPVVPESRNGEFFRNKRLRPAKDEPAPLFIDFTYFLDEGEMPITPERFSPTLDGVDVDFVRDFENHNFFDEIANSTIPSLTEYKQFIADEKLLIVSVSISRYLGNIFVRRISKRKAL